jgi:hypothetical protein
MDDESSKISTFFDFDQTDDVQSFNDPSNFFGFIFTTSDAFADTDTEIKPKVSVQRPGSSVQYQSKSVKRTSDDHNTNPFTADFSNSLSENKSGYAVDDFLMLESDSNVFASNFPDFFSKRIELESSATDLTTCNPSNIETLNNENNKFYNEFLTKSEDLIAKTQIKLEELNRKSSLAQQFPSVSPDNKESSLNLPDPATVQNSKSLINLKTYDQIADCALQPAHDMTGAIAPPTEADLLFDMNLDYNLNTEQIKKTESYYDLIGLSKSNSQNIIQQGQSNQHQLGPTKIEDIFNVETAEECGSPFKDNYLDLLCVNTDNTAKKTNTHVDDVQRLYDHDLLVSQPPAVSEATPTSVLKAPEILISEPLNEKNESNIVPEDFFDLRNEVPIAKPCDQNDGKIVRNEPVFKLKKKTNMYSSVSGSSDDDCDNQKPKFHVRIRPKPNNPDGQAKTIMMNVSANNNGFQIPLLPKPPKTLEDIENLKLERRKSLDLMNVSRKGSFSSDDDMPVGKPVSLAHTMLDNSKTIRDRSEAVDDNESRRSSFNIELPDEDDSAPLAEFYDMSENRKEIADGWILMIRYPLRDKNNFITRKTIQKLTEIRAWTETVIKIADDGTRLLLYYPHDLDSPFHEIELKSSLKFSELSLQRFDTYTKINTFKLQEIVFREVVQMRPDRLLSLPEKFLKHFTKAKANQLLDHMPFQFEVIKFAHLNFKYLNSFMAHLQEISWKLPVPTRKQTRPATRSTTAVCSNPTLAGSLSSTGHQHSLEEVTVKLIDEYKCKLAKDGTTVEQKCRTRVFLVAFINAEEPIIEIGLNDLLRHGKEVVGRYDIIPIKTETWIQPEVFEINEHVVDKEEFERTHCLRCIDVPDNQIVEIMRFRTRPRRNFELPLQVKCSMAISKRIVEIKIECMPAGSFYTNIADVYCQDVQIRFPIPDDWVYLFRVEKRFKYGAIHSAKSKFGKFKGLDRLLNSSTSSKSSEYTNISLQATCGQGKYEQAFKALVWRIDQLPNKNKHVYKTQLFLCKINLQDYDTIPESFATEAHVEFSMPICAASKCQVRSISVSPCDEPPAKWVKLKTKVHYDLAIDYIQANSDALVFSGDTVDHDLRALPQTESEDNNDDDDDDDDDDDIDLKKPVANNDSLIDFL